MASQSPLYLGFDLSTQQLKGVAVASDLKVAYKAIFDFDADSNGYDIVKGVITNEEEHEVYAPVALWLQAIDVVLERLQKAGLDFKRIRGISGAGQQHGSVYWSFGGEDVLTHLDSSKKLETQLDHAFSHPYSPNWQDASTQKECDAFDTHLGNPQVLATNTGSKAHHRFTGPQILRFQKKHHQAYEKTSHISLVSSWLASIFLGKIAPWDISDACGANLWDIKAGAWNQKLLSLASSGNPKDLAKKLGNVPESGGDSFGNVAKYFIERYGFHPDCSIIPFTGDNPSTILALPLRENDAMVSLGTSTTFLMSTRKYMPHPSVHFFNHPTTAGLYMFMLCYKNGGLAREKIRDALNKDKSGPWDKFDKTAHETPPLGQKSLTDTMRLGLFFPKPEIVPNLPAGTWKYHYDPKSKSLTKANGRWTSPEDDARAIIESQLLSLRLRSRDLVEQPSPNPRGLPAQPRRIYLVGGGSRNKTIARIAGELLGSVEGVFKLDVGENACALGAAYKAVWAVERKKGETFEDLIGKRWKEEDFIEKIQDGYRANLFEQYGNAIEGFAKMEEQALAENKVQTNGTNGQKGLH